MKTYLIGSAVSKEQLEKAINDYYYSKNYVIMDDGTVHNTTTKKTLDDVRAIQKKNRWRFERIENEN